MASHNEVILVGNLTRDPELRYLQTGTPVCSFGMAMSEKFKGQDGSMREDTCFVDVTFFGRTAEVCNEYLSKGANVFVRGKLKLDQWEKDGQKRSKLSVVGDRMQMLGGRGERSESRSGGPGSSGSGAGGTRLRRRRVQRAR